MNNQKNSHEFKKLAKGFGISLAIFIISIIGMGISFIIDIWLLRFICSITAFFGIYGVAVFLKNGQDYVE